MTRPAARSAARRHLLLLLVAATVIVAIGCDTIYYRTMKKFGKEKRDILVSRVKDARATQADAQQEFKSALERFQAIVEVEGSSLEDKYKNYLLYTSPSPRDRTRSRMPSSA